jgi:hypothetical protein
MSATKGKQPAKSYMRQPVTFADSGLCLEARALLQSIDNRFLPIHLACRFPRVLNQIARLWNRPARLDDYFDDLLIDRRGGRQGFPFAVAERAIGAEALLSDGDLSEARICLGEGLRSAHRN